MTDQTRREQLAKAMWREVSNYALRPARPLTAEEWEPTWNHTLGPAERDVWRRAADAALAFAAQEAVHIEAAVKEKGLVPLDEFQTLQKISNGYYETMWRNVDKAADLAALLAAAEGERLTQQRLHAGGPP